MNLKLMNALSLFILLGGLTAAIETAEKDPQTDRQLYLGYPWGLWSVEDTSFKYARNRTALDPHNATAMRMVDIQADYWNKAPHFYNGTHYADPQGVVYPCEKFTNGSIGTNCTQIYSDLYQRGYYDAKKPRCRPSLMQSYGLSGPMMDTKQTSPLCPNVKNSCCTKEDFFNAFKTWSDEGLGKNLLQQVDFLRNTYLEYLAAIQQASFTINSIGARIPASETKKNSCKLMAETINSFKIGVVKPALDTFTTQAYAHMTKHYQSFYCALCDAKNHPYFDLQRQRVVFSHRHTRMWLRQTLQFLLYFHVHIVPVNNLIVRFLSSCSVTGEFEKPKVLINRWRLGVRPRFAKSLQRCAKSVATSSWFQSCLRIFRGMSMTRIHRLYRPNATKLLLISSYIQANAKRLQDNLSQMSLDPKKESKERTKQARLLAEEAHSAIKRKRAAKAAQALEAPQAPNNERELQLTYPQPSFNQYLTRNPTAVFRGITIVPTALNAPVSFGRMRPAFAARGVDTQVLYEGQGWEQANYVEDLRQWAESQLGQDANRLDLGIHVNHAKLQKATKMREWGLTTPVAIMLEWMWLKSPPDLTVKPEEAAAAAASQVKS